MSLMAAVLAPGAHHPFAIAIVVIVVASQAGSAFLTCETFAENGKAATLAADLRVAVVAPPIALQNLAASGRQDELSILEVYVASGLE